MVIERRYKTQLSLAAMRNARCGVQDIRAGVSIVLDLQYQEYKTFCSVFLSSNGFQGSKCLTRLLVPTVNLISESTIVRSNQF